jgi:predicted  nucleic acid-binding Zn-ribbon protein
MQKSRTQHRKAVTLDTAVWPFSDTRVDKLENDVKGIRDDVAEIKEMVTKPTGQTRNGEHDVDADNNHDESQDDPGDDVVEKNGELTKLQTEIQESTKQIDETAALFEREMHDLKLRHDAALHQMQKEKEKKETHAESLIEEIKKSTEVHVRITNGVSSTASQYCVNLTR